MGHVHKNRWMGVYDRKGCADAAGRLGHPRSEAEADRLALEEVLQETAVEIYRIREKFGGFSSWHEAYAVIKEELDEFWDGVKKNDPDPYELVQVAACAQLAIVALCDKRRENKR